MKNADGTQPKISLWLLLRRTFPPFLKAVPLFLAGWTLISILHGLSWGVETLVNAHLFDAVAEAVTGNQGLTAVLGMLAVLGIVTLLSQVLNGVDNFLYMVFLQRAEGPFNRRILQKAGRLDPLLYENAETLDDINKAQNGSTRAIQLCLTIVSTLTFYLPYFIFMGIYLFTLKPILAISLLVVFLPTLISHLIRSTVFTKYEDYAAPMRRQMTSYEEAVCSRELFRETRLLGGFSFFLGKYLRSIKLLNKATWKAEGTTGLWDLITRLITIVGYGGVLFLLIDALLKGDITIGAFAAVFSSIGMLFGIMEEVICYRIGSISRDLGPIRNYLRFLELPERPAAEAAYTRPGSVEAQHLTFTYPSADRPSLQDVSLSLAPGETVAIVGPNGAGKTTLVKLLTGLYPPQEGSVFLGGLDTRTTAPSSLCSAVSGVFQQYERYKLTLRDNIFLGDIRREGTDEELLETAAQAGVLVDSDAYPEGLDTLLAREFDGVDVSGGQWQRIAIARGLYRTSDFIVLDEPTAAIDPLEESNIYRRFAEISRGKTALIVTHRLGSARIADRIVVMGEGRIVESGTHEELLRKDGKYTQMWQAQAQYYTESEAEA